LNYIVGLKPVLFLLKMFWNKFGSLSRVVDDII